MPGVGGVSWASVDNAVVTVALIASRFTQKVTAFCQPYCSIHLTSWTDMAE